MYSSDAAEQIVRMSLEGVEVAAKITGESAKSIAVLLAAVLREEHKTKGKARLTSMIKSGKELKVFSLQNKDLEKFAKEAKRYGVLYCVLRDKDNPNPTATVDVIARAEDAAKIQRIMERFELTKVDKASVVSQVEKDMEKKKAANPDMARAEKDPQSAVNLPDSARSKEGSSKEDHKPSVREKLKAYQTENKKVQNYDRNKNRNKGSQNRNGQRMPKGKSKGKER